MQTIKIYGASDDLVEVVGDVPGCDEYGFYDKPAFVELSTGDVFKVEYTERGVWTVEHHQAGRPGEAVLTVFTPVANVPDPDPHTEVMQAVGMIEWVEVWASWPVEDEEMERKVYEAIDHQSTRHQTLNKDDMRKIWDIVANANRRKK